MDFKGTDLILNKNISWALKIFNQTLNPDQTGGLLKEYKTSQSREKDGHLYNIYGLKFGSIWVELIVIFHNKQTPIRIEAKAYFPKNPKSGLLSRFINKSQGVFFEGLTGVLKNNLTDQLGKPTVTNNFNYWSDERKTIVFYTIDIKDGEQAISTIVYDNKHFSNQTIFDSVMKTKGVNLESTDA